MASDYPNTLKEAIQYFAIEDNCIREVTAMRWPDGKPRCPKCAGESHYWIRTQKRYKCKACRRQFSVKQGTIFEDSPIPLAEWLVAMWLMANCRNRVSSYEIARATGVSQKSAWYMLHRIRLACTDRTTTKIGGPDSEVEADETWIGGRVRNMHKAKRAELAGQHNARKTIVMGALDRQKGQVRAEVIPQALGPVMRAMLHRNVLYESRLYTDSHAGYDAARLRFDHEAVNHAAEEYVRGRVHTNGIENFWALLKRNLAGTYVSVEPQHLQRYVVEQVFRFNSRKRGDVKISDGERFKMLLSQIAGHRLYFRDVIGKVGETTN